MKEENEKKIQEIIDTLLNDLKNSHLLLNNFLNPIERVCEPHTLENLAHELRPKMVYGIGKFTTEWYEYIEQNERGSHGEVLSRFSPDENRKIELSLNNVTVRFKLLTNILMNSTHNDPVTSMKIKKLFEKAESSINLDSQMLELEAASYGFYDLVEKESIRYPLGRQIYTAYNLRVEIERLIGYIEEIENQVKPIIGELIETSQITKEKDRQSISNLQVLERIINRFSISIRSFNNKKRKGKQIIRFSDEYDFQAYLRLIFSAFFEIKWEDPIGAYTIDSPTGKIEFFIPEIETLIETKFISDDKSLKRALKSINDKIKVYSAHPNLKLIYFLLWDESGTIIDPESLENNYTGTFEFNEKKFSQKLKVLKK